MHFSRDSFVGVVLESSCMAYTLWFSVRRRLALAKKLLFLEVPFIEGFQCSMTCLLSFRPPFLYAMIAKINNKNSTVSRYRDTQRPIKLS